MASERDEYTAEGLLPNLAGHEALQIKKLEERARLAEQREAELVEALELAVEVAEYFIQRDMGAISMLEGKPISKESYEGWNELGYRRLAPVREILAKHKAEGREGS